MAHDPVVDRFLEFIAEDMARNPDLSVVAFPADLAARTAELTTGIEVDFDAAIDGPVGLSIPI